MRRVPVFLLLLAVLAGCGEGAKTVTVTTTVPATTGPSEEKTSLRVYFLENGRVQPVSRQVAKTQAVAGAALAELLKGPTPDERRLGLSTALETFSAWRLVGTEGVLRLTHAPELNAPAVAQIVFTLTQFPTVKAVDIDRKRYTRGDFENETPIIAVESPLPLQHVTSPLRATGTANTFEATFNYDLVDASGTVVATHFVTATSGSGQRGSFDFTVPFSAARPGPGRLVVYELSAKDGSRIHQSEIPLYLEG